MGVNDFVKEVLKHKDSVFSVDKLVSNDKASILIIVLFDSGNVLKGYFPNNGYYCQKYAYLRRECCGIKVG